MKGREFHYCPKHDKEKCSLQIEDDAPWYKFYFGKHSCPVAYPNRYYGNFSAKGKPYKGFRL